MTRPAFSTSSSLTLALACSIVASLLSTSARAQDVGNGLFPAERFHPTLDKDGIIDVEWGGVPRHLDYDVAVVLGYQLDPVLIGSRTSEGSFARDGALVGHRVGASVIAQLALFDFVELGVELPGVLFQAATNVDETKYPGVEPLFPIGVGDLRAVPKLRILRAEDQLVDLAILAALTAPTGFPKGNYLGENGFTFVPELAVSRDFEVVRLAGNLGARLRPVTRQFDLSVGPEVTYRVGVGVPLEPYVRLPIEVQTSLSGSANFATPLANVNQNPLELLAGGAWDITSALQLTGTVGVGLIGGAGTPDLRALVGLRFAPREHDTDGDGILDENDGKDGACKDAPEDKDGFEDQDGCPDLDNDRDGVADVDDGKGGSCRDSAEDKDGFEDGDGCPDLDNDQDGVADGDDKCALEAEDKDGFEDQDGCPDPDNDGDGIVDANDKCRDQAEDKDGFADEDGCPEEDVDGDGVVDAKDECPIVPGKVAARGCPDADSDGFVDAVDKCPTEAEVVNGVEDDDGCPDKGESKVVLTKEKIVILDKVFFDTGKATIKPISFPLLNQVASILKAHGEITKLRVEGHTDDVGPDDKNLALSQARAESVRDYLVAQGVALGRLEPVGFGETHPILPNATSKGREQNRRVEFNIVEQIE